MQALSSDCDTRSSSIEAPGFSDWAVVNRYEAWRPVLPFMAGLGDFIDTPEPQFDFTYGSSGWLGAVRL